MKSNTPGQRKVMGFRARKALYRAKRDLKKKQEAK